MVQVKGMARRLTQRFNRDLEGRVKNSTWWPWRSDSPSAARRAMPTRVGFGERGSRDIAIFAFCSPTINLGSPGCQYRRGATEEMVPEAPICAGCVCRFDLCVVGRGAAPA